MHPRVQVLKVIFELLRVLLPGDTVDSRRGILFQSEERLPKPSDVDVVKERGELHPFVSDCDLTHTVERIRRAGPALSPGRVLPARVSLGQAPSLRRLRSRGTGFVRRLRWYYEPVRLPDPVHRRSTALGLTGASRGTICHGRGRALPVLAQEVSARATGLRPRGAERQLALSLLTHVAFRLA